MARFVKILCATTALAVVALFALPNRRGPTSNSPSKWTAAPS